MTDRESSQMEQPKVFVSYAHETRDHKNWVKTLATDLRNKGIDALLDAWRVGLGEDFVSFMNEIPTCDRVLVVCTPAYATKSNEGDGGVGYERSVITAELAEKINTSKFICVLRTGSRDEAIPLFGRTRRYIDSRDDAESEVHLDEVLRDLHAAPKDPEPPVGESPFSATETPSLPDADPAGIQSVDADRTELEQLTERASVLLSRKDMPGWKRLLRKTRSEVNLRLNAWREKTGNKQSSEDTSRSTTEEGIQACEPLLVLALTAVDSEIESIQKQDGLIDDLIAIEGWEYSGGAAVANMPYALAFTYHHVLGAFLVSSNMHGEAIRVLTRTVRVPGVNEVEPVWQNPELIGYVKSFSGNCLTSWKFLCDLYGSKDWLGQFFHSGKSYVDSLRAYSMIASFIELASFLGKGGTAEKLKKDVDWLGVPPMFVNPQEDRGALLEEIVSKAIPDVQVLKLIAKIGKTDLQQIRGAWVPWIGQWLRALGRSHRILSHHYRTYLDHPPELPT